MSYVGYVPATVPFTADQIKPLGDQMYRRMDGANMPTDIFKNALNNPSFDHWQRGTSFSGTGAVYGADRWQTSVSNGATVSYTQQTFAIGDIASESRYFARVSVSGQSASTDYALFQQPIEGVRRFAGKRVVIRGMARRSAGSGNMSVELIQIFGTGGSANAFTYAGQVALSTTWSSFR